MIVVGIDENGLGPLLGPLVVTGTSFEVHDYDREQFWKLADTDLPADDSKVIFSRKDPGPAESAILDWLSILGCRVSTHDGLLEKIGLPLPGGVPCPDNAPSRACEPLSTPLPHWARKPPGGLNLGVWNRFDAMKVKPIGVSCHNACVGWLNRKAKQADSNKLRMDFELMMSIARNLCAGAGEDAHVLCGKVGGTAAYGPWLVSVGLNEYEIVQEKREESVYRVKGLGTVSFIRDGDSLHLPIAVASMVGKYVRELSMEKLNTILGWDGKRRASGYRDKVTTAFVEDTISQRDSVALPDSCFRRTR